MIWVLLAAWNEERFIRRLLRDVTATLAVRPEPFTVVLVDDGSTDRTVAEARLAVSESAGALKCEILSHPENRGLGAGLRTGIFHVLEHAADADVLVMLDADTTHPPATIPLLVERVRAGADLAIASRFRPGALIDGVPFHRRVLSDMGGAVFRIFHPIAGVRDYTCCFRAYSIPVLRRAKRVYGDELCTARGFEAVVDLLLRLGTLGVRVDEVGFVLSYGERAGHSKMKVVQTVLSTLRLVVRRRWEAWTRYSPRRIAELERNARGPA